jgi:hypothetical protein
VGAVPPNVTEVPPATVPLEGGVLDTVGAGYVHALPRVILHASLFVTVTGVAPIGRAGAVAVIVVAFTTTTFVAAEMPNVTVAPARNCVPVIVTAVPLAELLVVCAINEVVGGGSWNVNPPNSVAAACPRSSPAPEPTPACPLASPP